MPKHPGIEPLLKIVYPIYIYIETILWSSCGVCRTSLRNINALTSVTLIWDDQSLKSLSFLFITCSQMLHSDKAVPFWFWFPFTAVACYVFSICLRKFDLGQGRPSPLNSESYYIVFKINLFLCSFSTSQYQYNWSHVFFPFILWFFGICFSRKLIRGFFFVVRLSCLMACHCIGINFDSMICFTAHLPIYYMSMW